MRILFLGDVVGRSGRDGVIKHLPALNERFKAEVTIINVENAAGGFGITSKLAKEFMDAGATCLTTGNHIWKQREILSQIDSMPALLRPLNYNENTPGKGFYIHSLTDGRKILITNPLGRLFIEELTNDPFAAMDALLSQYRLGPKSNPQNVQAIFVDFHAEATSEKMCLGHFLDGRVSAVIGTHTHIPTADELILPKGTAYQTDAGMCGDYNSVIGQNKETAINIFTRHFPGERLSPTEGEATVCGTFIETSDETGLAISIKPVRVGGCLSQT